MIVTAGQVVLLAGVSVSFVLAMLRGGFARTGEVEELGAWLGGTASERMPLVNALRQTLGDETLVIVYWAAERRRFVDALGQPISLPVPGDTGRGITEIALGDRLIGALVYDRAMNEDPELVRTAGRVAAIAIDNERLTAELIANQAALRRSRARIVEAGDRERRSIAQNLHDGIQVELVLLAIEAQELGQAGSAADLDVAATKLRNGIDDAASHLRELVHAVMPAGLIERGLTAAVEDLVDRMPLPTSLVVVDVKEPLSPTVGSTAYFVVAEGLANAVKHAAASTLSVRLERTGSQLLIEVADDGVGGAAVGRGRRPAGPAGPGRRPRGPAGDRQSARSRHPPRRGVAMRIVIGEDEALLRAGLSHVLEQGGFDVVAAASDADELVQAVERHRPELLVTDIRMPPSHTDEGLRAALDIRQRHPALPVVVLSQHLQRRYAIELLAQPTAGVGYLLKQRIADVGSVLRRPAPGP